MAQQLTDRFILTDALVKVTPQWQPGPRLTTLSGLRGETVSMQLAWRPEATSIARPTERLVVEVPAGVGVHAVDLVAVPLPAWARHGDGYLTDVPGMLPDVLRPLPPAEDGTYVLEDRHVGWHAVWLHVTLPSDDVRIRVLAGDEPLFDETVTVSTVPHDLPPHGIEYAQWFHADCLATHYGVETWSDEHWRIIEEQLHAARETGVTMVLTPVWTPPLDTAVGSYRRTTQLLGISRDGGLYSFDTHHLDRWLEALAAAGIEQVEVPHLYTQWGATSTPRFAVRVDGADQYLFGWDTPATDPEYQHFLQHLLPFLKGYFADRMGLDRSVFHISDEPNEEHLDTYRSGREAVRDLLAGCRVQDALSHPEYTDLVDTPVVATDAVPTFRAAGVEPEWVYYCIAQSNHVSNRFIAQEAVRTRALGWQLYKAGAAGFLHWALNFYSSQLSRGPVNPFADTSAGGGFLSGDAFIVYPAPDATVWPSLRHRLMRDAFDDLAAARRAEEVLGRDAVLAIIDPDGELDYATGWVPGDVWHSRRRALDEALSAASS